MAKVNYATVSYVDEKFVELFNMNKATEKKVADMEKRLKALEGKGTKSGAKDGAKTKPEGKKPTAAELKAQKAKDAKFLEQWKYLDDHSKGNVRVDLKVKKGYRCLVEVEGREPGAGTWSVRKAAICVGYKWDKIACRYEVSNADWNAICDRFEALSKAK